jgi:hypothetical protein
MGTRALAKLQIKYEYKLIPIIMKKAELVKKAEGMGFKVTGLTVKSIKEMIKKSEDKAKKDAPKVLGRAKQELLDKVENHDRKTTSNWEKMHHISRKKKVADMSFSQMLKGWIKAAEGELSKDILAVMTFHNVKTWVQASNKYKDLKLFTENDAKMICNNVLKEHVASIALSERVHKQSKKMNKDISAGAKALIEREQKLAVA